MIHNVEDKTKKELVEIVKIQMEEYAKLNKLFEAADKAHTEIESQWLDMKQKLEAAERERDELAAYKAGKESMKLQQDDIINKFAIEQQIKGVNDFANKFCGECDTEYRVQLDSDANYYCKKLRQQLNGENQ